MATPDRMQRLLYARRRGMRRPRATACKQFVIERFGDPEGIGVLDETGIPKQGIRSVGVQKQYCGAVGKIETCQVATLLTYATARGPCLPGPAAVSARGVVLGPGTAGAEPTCPKTYASRPSRSKRVPCWSMPGSRGRRCGG